MNVKTAKKPDARVDVSYLSRFRLSMYGSDNLYPQNIASIVAASGTGTLCLNRYAKFVEGNGFVDVAFSEMMVPTIAAQLL